MATSRFTSYDFSDYDRAAAKVRTAKGKARLSPSEAADVRAAVARHETRAARGRSQPTRTRSTLLAQIQAEVSGQVTPIVERLYRTASSRWAGGDTIVTVRRGNMPSASGEVAPGMERQRQVEWAERPPHRDRGPRLAVRRAGRGPGCCGRRADHARHTHQ
jgi:hypothetical protein